MRGFVVAGLVILGAAFPVLSSPSQAAQCGGDGPALKEPALCSRFFSFRGVCGRPKYPYSGWGDVAIAVGAWETAPIRILTLSADAIISTKWHLVKATIMVGNSFNADPMTPFRGAAAGIMSLSGDAVAAVNTEQRFPRDLGMQFPATQDMPNIHLDVHLDCSPAGAEYTGHLSVWYVLDR